jgi:hypothetical protein
MDVQLPLGNVGDVFIFEVKHALGVLDYGGSVRRDEEFDGLGKAVL